MSDLVHFPSDRVGFTWCGLRLDIAPTTPISDGAQRAANGLLFATNMPVVTCPGCDTPEPAAPRTEEQATNDARRFTMAEIKAAFWKLFEGSGEHFFAHDDPATMEIRWEEFQEALGLTPETWVSPAAKDEAIGVKAQE